MYFSSRSSFIVILAIFILISCDVTDTLQETNESPLDMTYLSSADWYLASCPVTHKNNLNLDDLNLNMRRGNAYWHNLYPSDVILSDIIDSVSSSISIPVLHFVYDPNQKGQYNNNPTYSSTDASWAGVTVLLKEEDALKIGEKFNNSYLVMWISPPWNTTLTHFNIDIGEISEDVILNDMFDTEDHNYNEHFDDGEDTGLDRLFDKDESGYDEINIDPNNDNYELITTSFIDFSKSNYHENNNNLDSEDINNNWNLDKSNNYYTYKMPMDTTDNNYIVENRVSSSRWWKIRIPLTNYSGIVGTPNNNELEMLRIWFNGMTEDIRFRIVEMKFVVE
ncbi:MAG: hypothetical protein ABFS12_08585 [Bacteroidota bacterium]